VFGFPFGKQLGKNITVSKTSVSSLRKKPNGTLQDIQVNGGMHPGNSGGPVVDAMGQVVGVATLGVARARFSMKKLTREWVAKAEEDWDAVQRPGTYFEKVA
jgi:S1-C subfamily serine protease